MQEVCSYSIKEFEGYETVKWLSNSGFTGSELPEWWLSKSGLMAQKVPEYSFFLSEMRKTAHAISMNEENVQREFLFCKRLFSLLLLIMAKYSL